MTIKYADRVRETSVTTGAGNLTLAGAASSYKDINGEFNNDTDATGLDFDYVINHATNSSWEIGTGHLTVSNIMSRDTVDDNSNGNTSKINFAVGGLVITITPSRKTLAQSEVQTLVAAGTISTLDAAGASLLNEAATSTNPTLIPNKADPDTGMGWTSANTLAAIAGGVLQAELSGASGSELCAVTKDMTVGGDLDVTGAVQGNEIKSVSIGASVDALVRIFATNSISASSAITQIISTAEGSNSATTTIFTTRKSDNSHGEWLRADSVQNATFANDITVGGDVTLTEGKVSITDTTNEVALGITSSVTSAAGFRVDADILDAGTVAQFGSNSVETGSGVILSAFNDNAAAIGNVVIKARQDALNKVMTLDQNATGVGASFINFEGAIGADATSPISSFTTSGATTNHIQIELNDGTKAWVAISTNDPTA